MNKSRTLTYSTAPTQLQPPFPLSGLSAIGERLGFGSYGVSFGHGTYRRFSSKGDPETGRQKRSITLETLVEIYYTL